MSVILASSILHAAYALSGTWSPKIQLELSPTSAAHLRNGKILVWAANYPDGFLNQDKGQVYQILNSDGSKYNGVGLQSVDLPVMFCSGTAIFPNGDIMINGGGAGNAPASAIFNVTTLKFTAASNMSIARGYNSDILLTNDLIFTLGGSFNWPYGGRNAEVYNRKTNRWVKFDSLKGDVIGAVTTGLASVDPQGVFRSDNHAWLASWFNRTSGRHFVFHMGPISDMYLMDATHAPGIMKKYGTRPSPYSINAAVVMFAPGLYFSAGGATAYSTDGLTANSNVVIIDLVSFVNRSRLEPAYITRKLLFPRSFANAVVMPGGKIFVVGGQSRVYAFQDKWGVLQPEVYDPETGTFSLAPAMTTARNYHSFAILLYDGRIMVGGGGLCVARKNNVTKAVSCPGWQNRNWIHRDIEIFTPDYILKNKRPTVTYATRQQSFWVNGKIRVRTSCSWNCTFELIKRNSVTHSTNNDQIRVPLLSSSGAIKGEYVLSIRRSDQDWVTSGHYFLFVLQDGVHPSVSINVFVDASIRN